MSRRSSLNIACLALATAALVWGACPGRAQAEEIVPAPAKSGPFRDPESVPKLRSTTNAQREEAARKAAEYREEAARAAAHKKMTTSQPAAPPSEKGGAK